MNWNKDFDCSGAEVVVIVVPLGAENTDLGVSAGLLLVAPKIPVAPVLLIPKALVGWLPETSWLKDDVG